MTNFPLQSVNPVDVQHDRKRRGAVMQETYAYVAEPDILARVFKMKATAGGLCKW